VGGSTEYTMDQLKQSASKKEDFFAQQMAKNASKYDRFESIIGTLVTTDQVTYRVDKKVVDRSIIVTLIAR
jgi:hypothetical protein